MAEIGTAISLASAHILKSFVGSDIKCESGNKILTHYESYLIQMFTIFVTEQDAASKLLGGGCILC